MAHEILRAVILPMLIAFALSAVSGKFLIPYLRRIKAGQTEREDGPESHLAKTGTPNMGGLMILFGFTLVCLAFGIRNREIFPVLFLTLGFGAVGFADDYIKVTKKRSMGLRAWQKMVLQIVICLIFAFFITKVFHLPLTMQWPFSNKVLNLGILSVPFLVFAIVALVNGTNLNDGVDGMSVCVAGTVTLFFTIAAGLLMKGLLPAGGAMLGALLGFLLYNAHPAQVFMGDTGSLALGGFLAGMAYMMGLTLFIPLVGIIYVLEVLSVIIQVVYFKSTHGKRFFRMAPLHHHYELGGWSEVKVVAVFAVITVMACAIGLLGLR